MAQEHKVTRVSQEEPRVWDGDNGKVYYIKTMLEGHDKPVSIGKKSPDALKVGDTVYGDITETQYETDKFKAAKQFQQGGFKGQPRDDMAIRAQWAIGQAVQLHIAVTANKGEEAQSIEATAKELFAMVDRVKASQPEKKDWLPAETREKFENKEPLPTPPVDEVHEVEDEPISLENIPF